MADYNKIAKESRLKVLDLIYEAQTSHIGSNFSCSDIMAVLFERIDLDKDRFVLSAGWKAATLYYHLWRKGRITQEQLDSYCKEGSDFIGLAEPIIPEIKIAGGSMGLGLPGAVGLAMAKKLKGEDGTVFCLMSDGELAIGTTWESALIAVQHKLNNLVVIVDSNGLQAMGSVSDVLYARFPQAGFEEWNVGGHDYSAISSAISSAQDSKGAPKVIVAYTIKGKGVSFMEGNNLYHYKQLSDEEYQKAKQELWEK